LLFHVDPSDAEGKKVKLEGRVTCGEVIKALAEALKMRPSKLALVGMKINAFVRFHNREAPASEMMLKGVENLKDLPDNFTIKEKTELELEEGLQIQEELIEVYSDPAFIKAMIKIREECIQQWDEEGQLNTRLYNEKMRPLLTDAQTKVLPKWGYESGMVGMMKMQSHFQPLDPLPVVANNVFRINKQLGMEFEWISGSE